MKDMIYKILPAALWHAAADRGALLGVPVDLKDGYIHFSTAAQVKETAAKHFAGQDDLLLVAVDPAVLGEALRWEPSRGGQLFPHLYSELDVSRVASVRPLPRRADGTHEFPDLSKDGA